MPRQHPVNKISTKSGATSSITVKLDFRESGVTSASLRNRTPRSQAPCHRDPRDKHSVELNAMSSPREINTS